METLEELVARAASGGEGASGAFALLYDELQETVYRWVLRLVWDGHVAEDLSQEVWLKVAQNIGKYRPGANFMGWLKTITRNTALDYLRNIQRRPPESLCADHLELDRPRAGQSTEELAENRALARAVEAQLHKLRPDQRQVLILRFFDGESPGRTAEIMGKSDGAVRTLTFRALRRLAEVMPVGESSAELIEELLTVAVGNRVVETHVEREARSHAATR
ncbi:RNA polymerase sigma factor [Streptomyces sp. NPDC048717]|uniref:RNA polymerase sigma factor n=1 Tax=Streptomyces sp. NPDC048717 TaxID=3154928 RepID=UPI003419C566